MCRSRRRRCGRTASSRHCPGGFRCDSTRPGRARSRSGRPPTPTSRASRPSPASPARRRPPAACRPIPPQRLRRHSLRFSASHGRGLTRARWSCGTRGTGARAHTCGWRMPAAGPRQGEWQHRKRSGRRRAVVSGAAAGRRAALVLDHMPGRTKRRVGRLAAHKRRGGRQSSRSIKGTVGDTGQISGRAVAPET